MSITKSSYNSNTQISPFYVRIKKDQNSLEILIDEITPGFATQMKANINRNEVWVTVEADYSVTVLSSQPNNLNPLGNHTGLSTSLVKIKGGEVFITAHASTPQADNNQTAVTGYSFGTFDKVYLKIDRVNDAITVYEAPDNA